jgi:hypothetical protein
MKRSASVMVFLLAVLWANVGIAGMMPGSPIQIGIGGGVSVPVSDAGDVFKSGWHATGIVRLNMPGIPVDLGAALGYQRFKLDPEAVGFGGTSQVLSGLGNVTLTLPVPGPIKPYVTAGLGAFNTKIESDSTGASHSKTNFGIDGGVGVKFKLLMLNGFIEGKIQNVFTDEGFNAEVAEKFEEQIIPVTFGIFL